MRLSRFIQLYEPQATLHLFWRCHNKEFYLTSGKNKALYMQAVKESLTDAVTSKNVRIHAYCVMNNHYHQATSYTESSRFLSNYMRHAHSLFGSRYNKAHKRSGKVAESRPKTALIEDPVHEMKVHFYIEANPIRAGICKFENLHLYKYSSFKFYAYGITDENSSLLTIPQWYLALGRNFKERRKAYLKLFKEYLEESRKPAYIHPKAYHELTFIGSTTWIEKQKIRIRDSNKNTS